MPRGGKRPGSGNKKGAHFKHKATISKELAREALRQVVLQHMGTMTAAQIANATGIKYLVLRSKLSGKFLRVGEQVAKNYDPDTEVIEVWEKDPSVQAFTDLMDRALDKAGNSVQEVKVTGEVELIQKLYSGRQKAADAKRLTSG